MTATGKLLTVSLFILVVSLIYNNGIWDPYTLVSFITFLLFLYFYSIFFEPLDYTFGDPDIANKRLKPIIRKYGKNPPVYPNGWFKLCNSWEVKKGEIKSLKCLGQDIIVFRGENSKVGVLDAFCPHLGAHLGVGRVVDNYVECAFHGWKFDAEGKCREIPYNKNEKIPEIACVRNWPIMEVNGGIFLHFDAEGREPFWNPRIHKQVTDGSWVYHGHCTHYINAHIQEIPENGADVAHFNVVHPKVMHDFLPNILSHRWEGAWEPDAKDAHVAHVTVHERLMFLGCYVPGTYQRADVTQDGPGVVHLEFSTILGKAVVFQTLLPIGPFYQKCQHVIFAEKKVPRFFAKFLLYNLAKQLERDIPIWNTKAYIAKPVLVKHDGKIAQFRRWYANFYSENSPTAESCKDNMEW